MQVQLDLSSEQIKTLEWLQSYPPEQLWRIEGLTDQGWTLLSYADSAEKAHRAARSIDPDFIRVVPPLQS